MIYRISRETFDRLERLINAGQIKNCGIVFPYGGIETDKEWIIETDFDDPYFAYNRETGEWAEHKAIVKGEFLYSSYELTDADLPLEITTYHPNINTPEKTSEILKGVAFRTPSKELKEKAPEITFEEAIEKITEANKFLLGLKKFLMKIEDHYYCKYCVGLSHKKCLYSVVLEANNTTKLWRLRGGSASTSCYYLANMLEVLELFALHLKKEHPFEYMIIDQGSKNDLSKMQI